MMSQTAGRHVRLFLVEGGMNGLVTAEIMNWTGHLILAPRSNMPRLLRRDEVKGTGVYILLGDDPEGAYGTRVYIGEGDSIEGRLRSHARTSETGGKDFWDRVIVITSKDANITKAHARYLESRLIEMARDAKRARLDNGTAPPVHGLPEADRSDMEYFIEQLHIVLPALGVNIFRKTRFSPTTSPVGPDQPAEDGAPDRSPVFQLRVAKNPDRYAQAREVDAEFVVAAGSSASAEPKTMQSGYQSLRTSLIDKGILVPASDGTVLELREDYVFRSPSAAASVMTASSQNGLRSWAATDGRTYGQWQASRAEEAPDT